jgi:MFS transporter, putative metabolite:H+ symporter
MMPARTAPARPPAAVRLDRLAIAGFHRDIVRLLAYIFFFELGDLNSFAFAAPGIRQEWQLSLGTIGTITSAAFVGMFIGATTGGWFSDRVGRKRALVVTTVWYSAFSLMNALAWSVPSLVATRMLTGVGLSSMTVVAMTYIAEMFPARSRGAYQARILMIGLCGIPATAYVARFLIPMASWGWRAVFVWGGCAIFFPLFAGRLEESPRWFEHRNRLDEADAAMDRIEGRIRRESGELPPLPAVWSASIARPGGLREIVSSGSLRRAVLLIAIWSFQTLGIYGFLTWVPTLLVERGFSIVNSLQQSSAMSIGAVPGAWIGEKISDRWERKSLIAIVALVIATFGMSYGLSNWTVAIVVFGFLVAAGQQVFASLLYAYTPECFPTQVRNTGTGLAYGGGRLANALGPLLVAFLFQRYGYTSVFEYIAVCWAMVAVLVAFGPKTRGKTLA